MIFLAAFIRASMGDAAKAAAHARHLRSVAGKVGVHKVYADYLLTGPARRAKPAPTTMPAKP